MSPTTPAKTGSSSARQRLLRAADRLFYAQGINATGVDSVVAEADVARMTLYKHFGGKDGLVAAYLEERDARWRRDLEEAIAAAADALGQLLAVFDVLALWVADPQFRGCAFANAAAEIAAEGHPARRVALGHKQALRQRLGGLASAAGFEDPDRVVDQLMLLIEGAIVATALRSVDEPVASARNAAHQMLHSASRPC